MHMNADRPVFPLPRLNGSGSVFVHIQLGDLGHFRTMKLKKFVAQNDLTFSLSHNRHSHVDQIRYSILLPGLNDIDVYMIAAVPAAAIRPHLSSHVHQL